MPKTPSKLAAKATQKSKSTTVKKPAVSKKRSAPSKKTQPEATAKKRATTKKVTRTKALTTTKAKRASKQASGSKTAKKKTVKLTAPANTKKPTTVKQPAKSESDLQTKSSVVLPERMSIRAREKALVLTDAFEKNFYTTGLLLARAGGACFLILGTLAIFTQFNHSQLTQSVCGVTTDCQSGQLGTVHTSVAGLQELNSVTGVKLLADVPDIIETPIGIPFEASSAQTVTARVVYLTASGREHKSVPVESIGNTKYELYLDPTELAPNQYELLITLKQDGLLQVSNYTLGYFAILPASEQLESETSIPEPDDVSDQLPATPVVTNLSEEVIPESTSSTTDLQPANEPEVTATKPVAEGVLTDETSSEMVKLERDDSQEVNELTPVTPAPDEPEKPLDVDTPLKREVIESNIDNLLSDNLLSNSSQLEIEAADILSGLATVTVSQTKKEQTVLFYIRPVQTLNTQSIGQLIPGTRNFRFDTRQFPNGQYQLYAESRIDRTVTKSNTIRFAISNSRPVSNKTPVAQTDESAAVDQKRDLLDLRSEITAPETSEETSSSSPNNVLSAQNQLSTTTVMDRTRSLLQSDADKLNEIFQRYAVAEQSGDEVMISETKRSIDRYRQEVVSLALTNDEDQTIAQELDENIERELNQISQRVRTFEALRRDRTESASALDTDGDGISDFDEIYLYNTDPYLADTDNDGFTDGVEVMRGFNPIDPAVEAAITYQSPKESVGIVVTDKLQVLQVDPKVSLATDGAAGVQAVVKGKGLPNSFVTLFIFSTPTIVTVRTEADGTFEYTFSKELEDGQHEVYVALTDNTGSIVAQSEPFTFIKQAQAFTPVDAQNTTAALDPADQPAPYRMVLGMSVFALGILLVLLGIGLKGNRPEVTILEDKPV